MSILPDMTPRGDASVPVNRIEAIASQGSTPAASAKQGRAQILVVDDNEGGRYALAHALRQAGYSVLEARCGEECLRRIRADEPDIVVLDVDLPDVSGMDICRRLKEAPETALIPVLQISARFVTDADRIDGFESGADGYLVSPYEKRELLARVEGMLRVRRAEQRLAKEIEERKAIEVALRAKEERLALAQRAGGVGVFDWDVKTGEVEWSEELETIYGMEAPGDPKARPSAWLERVHPEDRDEVLKCSTEWLASRAPEHHNEYRLIRPDGEERWIAGHSIIFRDAEGGAVRVVGTNTDITQRKQAEEALRESEARFRIMADGLPLIVWVHDAEGRQQFVNRRFCEFFGITLAELTGEKWRELLHPDDAAGYAAEFAASVAERRLFQAQARARKANGEWRWLESFARPRLSDSGEFLGMVGTSVDITERKQAEQVLTRGKEELEQLVTQRTERLKELVTELEHFSYTITHDMRAPLRAMRGLAEILNEEETQSSEQERRKFIHRIITAAERMDGLITDALQYSKMVKQELPLAPVDLGSLLQGMLETYPELQSANAEISIEQRLPLVLGNEAALTQCFSNLLGNAVKFGKPGRVPKIRVWSEMVETQGQGVGPEEGSDWVRIWVQDDGIGISKSMKPRVFQMFSRGSNPMAGTGIGLALVRKVVDRMGGRVGVESEEGQGSRFWVELKRGSS